MIQPLQLNTVKNNPNFGSVHVQLKHTAPLYGIGSAAEQSFDTIIKILNKNHPGLIVERHLHPDGYPSLVGIITAPIHWAAAAKDNFDSKVARIFEGIDIFKGKISTSPNIEIAGLSESVKESKNLKLNA